MILYQPVLTSRVLFACAAFCFLIAGLENVPRSVSWRDLAFFLICLTVVVR